MIIDEYYRQQLVEQCLQVSSVDGRSVATILIHDRIATRWWFGFSPESFAALVAAAGSVDEYVINLLSEGGDTIGANAIVSAIKLLKKPTRAVVEIALSAATTIALGCDSVEMSKNGWWMIHYAAGDCWGRAADHRAMAEQLETLDAQLLAMYVEKTGQTEDTIRNLMETEKWLSGQQALDLGFVDQLTPEITALSTFTPASYSTSERRVLTSLSAEVRAELRRSAPPMSVTISEIKQACPGASPEFILSLAENAGSLTIEQVGQRWSAEQIRLSNEQTAALQAERDALQAELQTLKNSAQKPGTPAVPPPGNKPVGGGSGSDTTPPAQTATDEWQSLVNERVKSGSTRQDAIRYLVNANPELHQRFLAEADARAGSAAKRRLVTAQL